MIKYSINNQDMLIIAQFVDGVDHWTSGLKQIISYKLIMKRKTRKHQVIVSLSTYRITS